MNADATRDQSRWTFLTNHLHMLACLTRDPELRIRDLADLIGITERTTAQILSQLEAAGYLTKTRVGRRNHYTVHGELPLRHPMHNGRQVGELLRVLEREIPPRGVAKLAPGHAPGLGDSRRFVIAQDDDAGRRRLWGVPVP